MQSLRRVPAVVGLVLPMVLAPAVGFGSDNRLLLVAVGPSAAATIVDRRRAWALPPAGAVVVVVALLASRTVPTTVLFMVALAVAAGMSAAKGWHPALTNLAAWTSALAIIAPGDEWAGRSYPATSVSGLVIAAAVVVIVGGWTVACTSVVAHGLKLTAVPAVAERVAATYAGVLALLVGVTTLLAITVFARANAWWIPMTLFFVVVPDLSATRRKVLGRVLGTAVGVVVAGAIALLLGSDQTAIGLVSTVALAGALWANFAAPYAVYAAFLTGAVVLQSAHQTRGLLTADADRLAFTAVAAIAAYGACLLLPRLARATPR